MPTPRSLFQVAGEQCCYPYVVFRVFQPHWVRVSRLDLKALQLPGKENEIEAGFVFPSPMLGVQLGDPFALHKCPTPTVTPAY